MSVLPHGSRLGKESLELKAEACLHSATVTEPTLPSRQGLCAGAVRIAESRAAFPSEERLCCDVDGKHIGARRGQKMPHRDGRK